MKKSLLPEPIRKVAMTLSKRRGDANTRRGSKARAILTSATHRARLAAAEKLRGPNGEWCPLDKNGGRILTLVPEIREFVPHGHFIIVDCYNLCMYGTRKHGIAAYNMTGPLTRPEVHLWGPSMFMLGRGVTVATVNPGLILSLHKESNVVSHNLEINLNTPGVLEFDLYKGLYTMKFTFGDPRLLTFGDSLNHADNPLIKVTGDDLVDVGQTSEPTHKRLPRP